MPEQQPVYGAPFTFHVMLESIAAPGTFQANPTINPGDVAVSIGGAAFAPATAVVVAPAGSQQVQVNLTAAEMTGTKITVRFTSSAAQWFDHFVEIHPLTFSPDQTPKQIWDYLLTAMTVAGSIGRKLQEWIVGRVLSVVDTDLAAKVGSNFDIFFQNAGNDTTKIVDNVGAGGGGGLTAQQTRDAMKLAPTAGAPAAGSIDQHLDDIEGKTTNLPADPASETNVDAEGAATRSQGGAGPWTGADVSGLALEATAQGIKAKTDGLPVDPASEATVAAEGAATRSQGGPGPWATATGFATPGDDMGLSAAAYTEIHRIIRDMVVETEGGVTLQQALSVYLSALAGVTKNLGGELYAPGGVNVRIQASIDAVNQERDTMVLTPSAPSAMP